ncbi:hypothetical protein BDR04DRAFT_315566 [Suillus decipiens]|nr:hypothetical protein BDR04DRAFT_315566 [Suillus decipiens]
MDNDIGVMASFPIGAHEVIYSDNSQGTRNENSFPISSAPIHRLLDIRCLKGNLRSYNFLHADIQPHFQGWNYEAIHNPLLFPSIPNSYCNLPHSVPSPPASCLPYVAFWSRFHLTFAYCHRIPSSFLSFSYPMQAQSRLKYCHAQ